MDTALTHTISLLGVAIIVAIIVRRMRLPYTVGLVLTGQGLAVAGAETGAMLTHDFIFEVILPPPRGGLFRFIRYVCSFGLRNGPYPCASSTSSGGVDCEGRWHWH